MSSRTMLSIPGVLFILLAGCGLPQSASGPTVKVELGELLKANATNPIATFETYKGQVVETEGYIERIEPSSSRILVNLVLSADAHYLNSPHLALDFDPAFARALKDHAVKSRVRVRLRIREPQKYLKATGHSIDALALTPP